SRRRSCRSRRGPPRRRAPSFGASAIPSVMLHCRGEHLHPLDLEVPHHRRQLVREQRQHTQHDHGQQKLLHRFTAFRVDSISSASSSTRDSTSGTASSAAAVTAALSSPTRSSSCSPCTTVSGSQVTTRTRSGTLPSTRASPSTLTGSMPCVSRETSS